MVAEMTGGYQLLVPAGLAVMLSFLIQINLSSFFKYCSLYEAQVAGRADSPPHRTENIRIALQLLDQGKVSLPPNMNHLHLAALLQSGVALDLPDGSQLVTGALRPESPWVGKQIQSRALSGPVADTKIIAVLRGKSVILARPENGVTARRPTPVHRFAARSNRIDPTPKPDRSTRAIDGSASSG